MPRTPEHTQELASILLKRPLDQYVLEKRNARPHFTWEMIAEDLAADTNGRIRVSAGTVRNWYGPPAEVAS